MNHLFQGWPIDIFHHQKVLSPLFDEVIDCHRVGMGESSSSTCLAAKSFNGAEVVLIQRTQNFNRDHALYTMIPGFKDTGHTACRNMFPYLVASCNRRFAFKLVHILPLATWEYFSTFIHIEKYTNVCL